MATIRFGVNIRAVSGAHEFRDLVQRADELGYDLLAVPDHLGTPAPFAALAAAAQVSARLRLRTYVLNVGFWNAALLAREVATLDVLSDGRAELGLGAGHMRHEHEAAGLPWLPLGPRSGALEAMVGAVRARLADDGHAPRPVQRPVPLLVGGMSDATLAVAARHADVVGFSGLRQVDGAPLGTFTVASAAETAERVDQVRAWAGGRPYGSDALLQLVALGGDPEEAAADLRGDRPTQTVARILDSPFVLLAPDAAAAAAELRRRQEVYGFDGITTHQPNLEALGQVIAAYRSKSPGTG